MVRPRDVPRCCVPGCDRTTTDGVPVPLCLGHVTLVGDFAAEHVGVEDLLPGPCIVCGGRIGVRFPTGTLCAVCEWRFGDVPDGELGAPRVDVVYYLRMRDESGDRVKIGTTANPRQRLGRIAHQDLLGFERGDRTLERRRHAEFAASRYPGTEWFRVTPELLAHVGTVAAGAPDPWALHTRWVSEALALRV
ncbi:MULTISPECIES: GIY-YIG nuclease family protein [unclassified Curtobacterium]|uniref:GIY-YIG nuclease family protein n=1 Tax=unclassified Curtobacterium TaxID=257496 RepID=UPI000D883365|nr:MULTISPECIES: GIY-YIG nuclease family protein [unclassified Curtobacterium]PYY43262.1 GIY-YIG nuclease family protein [Curtobacterium sp. MCPF17_046]WIB16869.1 GIY-YIG nuclease family protein [Curtobacterium sp. MCPF17_050]